MAGAREMNARGITAVTGTLLQAVTLGAVTDNDQVQFVVRFCQQRERPDQGHLVLGCIEAAHRSKHHGIVRQCQR